jgi:3-keto-5-aminohexanoate cleavage enzyme
MVAGLGVDIRPLIPYAVAHGGHVRVGLEDASWGTTLSNRMWVEDAVRLIRECGGEPAPAKIIRAKLGGSDRD